MLTGRRLPRGSLQTGFTDGVYSSPDVALRERWLARTVSEHASTIRIDAGWSAIAPRRPPDAAAARDPGWAGYDFAPLDASVSAAAAHHLRILITITGAPAWAEGAHRPASAAAGSWRPSPRAFGRFATASARRYGGSFTPPGARRPLPRVRYWQAWNEPNLSLYLAPQWQRTRHGLRAASPAIYRALLDSFYRAIHRAGRGEQVLSAGTAPYGEEPGGSRMRPVTFVEDLLCLTPELRPAHCAHRAEFDILDHHPYSIEGPFWHALDRGDVAIADMGKLIRPLRAAERLHTVGGARRHAVWVTEVSWDSDPPDPHGVPARKQALWLEQTLWLLWRQGVSTVLWYQILDSPPIPNYASTYQSGTYLLDGRPKPSATAFRFPFVRTGLSGGVVSLWGKSPSPGRPVSIQRLRGSHWQTIATVPSSGSGLFEARLRLSGGPRLRARAGGLHSLALRA